MRRVEPLAVKIYEGWRGPHAPTWDSLSEGNPDRRYRKSYYVSLAREMIEKLDGHPLSPQETETTT